MAAIAEPSPVLDKANRASHGRSTLNKELSIMVRKFVAMFIVAGAVAIAGCNTVRGAGEDLGSAANCTENVIHQGGC